MGYIRNYYGIRSKEFIEGFLAAMNTYAVWKDGKQFIGSPETELKSAMKKAVSELSEGPEDFNEDIDEYF